MHFLGQKLEKSETLRKSVAFLGVGVHLVDSLAEVLGKSFESVLGLLLVVEVGELWLDELGVLVLLHFCAKLKEALALTTNSLQNLT